MSRPPILKLPREADSRNSLGAMEPAGLPPHVYAALRNLIDRVAVQADYYIGYPNALDLDFNVLLGDLLRYPINNVGDPYVPNAGINTCQFEQEIVEFFLQLLSMESSDRW